MVGSAADENDELAEFQVSMIDPSPPGWPLGKGEVVKPWSYVAKGDRVLWWIGPNLKVGTVMVKKGISMRVLFDGDVRPTNIPNARTFWVQHRLGKKEQNLYCVRPSLRIKGKTPGALRKTKEVKLADHTFDGDLINSSEAVKLYGIGGKELRRLLRNGKVLGRQADGRWLVDATSLGRYLSNRS